MSYILDALKKSEQERGHGNVPGVQTVHTSSLSYKDKKAYWPYILITAVVLNLVVMLYFFLGNDRSEDKTLVDDRSTEALATDNLATKKTKPATEAAAGDSILANTQVQAYTDRDIPSDRNRSQETIPEDDAAEIETNLYTIEELSKPVLPKQDSSTTGHSEIISYHELDESIKQQLPAIIVSAHVYSSNPQQRSIVINNNFLEEGEYIIDGLILHEITPNGAILNYHGILFRSDVVSGWQ